MIGAVMASVLLMRALPREAMSAQRIREERLINRGEEYARAIELYFREHQKYPQELDDLEDTNGVRYLRRRYKDPMTGEDEWRLIHVGTDGRFKDSLIYDTEDPEEMMSADGRMGAGGSGFGGSPSRGAFGNRPSSRGQRTNPTAYQQQQQQMYAAAPQPGVFQGANRAMQVRQSAAPDNPLERQQGQFGAEDGEPQPAGDPNDPENAGLGPDGRPLPLEQQQPTDYSNAPPGQVPPNAGQRQQAGPQGYPVQPTGGPGYSLPTSRGAIGRGPQNPRGGFAQQQQQPGGPAGPVGMQNVSPDAASVIGRLLTTPRPGGLAGIQGRGGAAMQQGQQGAQAFQEGIAGVASKSEETGAVKVYKGMENYKEWEFVYDYRQDSGVGGMPGAAPQGNINPNQPGLTGGGGLTGNPGAFQPIQGIPGQTPAATAPPQGPDPRQTQFGGGAATPNLPSTMPQPAPDPYPNANRPAGPDAEIPENPAQTNPGQPTAPTTQNPQQQDPNRGRTYSLPRSRGTGPN